MKKYYLVLSAFILLGVTLVVWNYYKEETCPDYIKEINGCEILHELIENCQDDIVYDKTDINCYSPLPKNPICEDSRTKLNDLSIEKTNKSIHYGSGCSMRLIGVAGLVVMSSEYNYLKKRESLSPGDIISYFEGNETIRKEAFKTNNITLLEGNLLTHRVIYVDKDSILTETDHTCQRQIIHRDSFFLKIDKVIILKKHAYSNIFKERPRFTCSGGWLDEYPSECEKQINKYNDLYLKGDLPSCWTILPKKELLDYSIAID